MPKVYFVAEAGKNFIDHDWYNEKMVVPYYAERAIRLIKIAKEAGADVVKFQTHIFEDEQYLRDQSRHDWIKFNEEITPLSFWKELKMQCDHYGIEFMTTPMSKMAAEKVNDLVKKWKVGSASVTDKDLLKYIASTKKPVILSTGMSTMKQLKEAIEIVKDNELTLLYCKSVYPYSSLSRLNLVGGISNLHYYFPGFKVGFSDHTVEVTTPAKAVVAGAQVVEKHFTFDKDAIGPDHKFSLSPEELKISVQLTKEYEHSNFSIPMPDEEELKLWPIFRKGQY